VRITSRIGQVFQGGHKALIGYVTAGYPDIEATPVIATALADAGCDIIELGIPFSDPLADGATIQQASYRALLNGTTPRSCLEAAARIRQDIDTPLVFMTYYNPVLSYGLEAFCRDSAAAGINGLIVPDLPPEEGGELEPLAREHGLDLVYLLAPTSTGERIKAVAARSRGFIYLVSLTGVTGARQTLPPDLEIFVKRVRRKTALPLCVGFGIATPEQARRIGAVADGVIVGSRLIQLIDEDATLASLKSLVTGLRRALDSSEDVREVNNISKAR
jgi:tryptophan synthase alpha chain